MNTVYFDTKMEDDARRARLYDGHIFVFPPRKSTRALCRLARDLAEEAFHPLDPRIAQHELPVERYVEVLAQLKPKFIRHPDAKPLISSILEDLGCNMEETYFDLPRLRTSTCNNYLTSGLAYAFKPHRDTWYSTPQCQLNWWLPVYEVASDNVMTFHTRYWNRPVKNTSSEFNYQDWNDVGRLAAGKQGQKDTRKQSAAIESLELESELRAVTEPSGVMIFSAAHLHSRVPNSTDVTRLSIDFHTVNLCELRGNAGATTLTANPPVQPSEIMCRGNRSNLYSPRNFGRV